MTERTAQLGSATPAASANSSKRRRIEAADSTQQEALVDGSDASSARARCSTAPRVLAPLRASDKGNRPTAAEKASKTSKPTALDSDRHSHGNDCHRHYCGARSGKVEDEAYEAMPSSMAHSTTTGTRPLALPSP